MWLSPTFKSSPLLEVDRCGGIQRETESAG